MRPGPTRHYRRLSRGRGRECGPLSLVHAQILGKPVTFCVDMENDPIQRNHRRGQFYEQRELRALASIFPKGGTFLDIGANIGNHTLFAALFLEAGRVIPVEPNQRAYNLLVNNVIVNGLRDTVDLSCLGVGVSDERSGGFAMERRDRNLGAARMIAGQGDLEVFRADALFAEETPDFIKIDVEAMELKALAGLTGLLARCRPLIMVEVDNENDAAFEIWMHENGYASLNVHQRYKTNKNHLIVDEARLAELKGRFAADNADAAQETAVQEDATP